MTNEHPITPPPELVLQWCAHSNEHENYDQFWRHIATQAARWGADQELEACCQALYRRYDIPSCISPKVAEEMRDWLRATRRPKPPSLKEQALADLDSMSIEPCLINGIDVNAAVRAKYDNIRRALEALPDSP